MTLLDAQKLVRDVDGQVAPLAGGAETLERQGDPHGGPQRPGASAEVPGDADRGRDARAETGRQDLHGTAALMGPDSAVLNDLSRTLRSLDEAARSIRPSPIRSNATLKCSYAVEANRSRSCPGCCALVSWYSAASPCSC